MATSGHTPPLVAGPLVERHGAAGRRLAGTLLPQPTVLLDGLRCRLDDVLGPGPAELTWVGGNRIRVTTADETTPIASTELTAWLRDAGATTIVVRPDRIVRSAT